MKNSWNRSSGDVIMSGSLKELLRRIEENLDRGMELVAKPVRLTNMYVQHSYDYSTLHKPSFKGKKIDLHEKWQCKMRYPKLSTKI